MNKNKALKLLDKIKLMGFEEHWPPSQTCWFYLNKVKGVSLEFHWPTYSFRGHLTRKTIEWSQKHSRYVAV